MFKYKDTQLGSMMRVPYRAHAFKKLANRACEFAVTTRTIYPNRGFESNKHRFYLETSISYVKYGPTRLSLFKNYSTKRLSSGLKV